MNFKELARIKSVKRQPEDERDYIFKAQAVETTPSAYINPNIAEIENQGGLGSCVANATCSSLEMMIRDKSNMNLSRLFVYYNAREPYPSLKEIDGGAYVRDGFKSVYHQGVCNEVTWTYDENMVNTKPDEESYKKALDYKVKLYERINMNVDDIKSAILANQPVIYGTGLTNEFFAVQGPLAEQNYAGIYEGKRATGYHAMSVVGYDDELGGFIIENSWGTNWGDKGLFLSKYDDFIRDSFDIWTCSAIDFVGLNEKEEEKEEEIVIEDEGFFTKIWNSITKIIKNLFKF